MIETFALGHSVENIFLTTKKYVTSLSWPFMARICIIAFALIISGCATPKVPQRVEQIGSDLYYGGVYLLAGSVDAIPGQFPQLYSHATLPDAPLKKGIFNLFRENRDAFVKVNLKGFAGDLAPDDAIVMANGFSGEKYFSEASVIAGSEIRNFNAYLSGSLLLQKFNRKPQGGFDINLLACYPYSISIKGLVPEGKTPEESGGQALVDELTGVLSDDYTSLMRNLAGKVAPVSGLGALMQVRDVALSDKTVEFTEGLFDGNEKNLKQWIAGEVGAQLSRQIGIPVIPYAEDTSNRKLAQMMESGEAYNISLPEPDFVIDIDILGFARALQKETASEAMWAYGAYGKFRVIEARTGILRWESQVKAGVPKRIWKTQTDVDHHVAEFRALLALIGEFPEKLLADKKARPIIEACLK